MAQTGYTPILIYSSSTVAQAPAAGNLTNSTLGSELAINITDGKLFYKDNTNAVQVIAWKVTPTTAGGTGLTSYTAGDLLYYATGTTLAKLTIGASTTVLTSSGTAPQWTAQSALSVGEAANLKSNATTGVMQITGPAAASTRVMTIPDANFTVARTDTGQTFTGNNTFGVATSTTRTVSVGGSVIIERFGATPQLEILGGTNSTVGYSYRININQTNWTLTNAVIGSGQANIVSIDNATKDITVSAGNLIQGTAAKGVNFTANTPRSGMTSQLLNWYEEGTFTPTLTGSNTAITLTYTTQTGMYTRVGRLVTVTAYVQVNTISAAGSGFLILNTGLWNSDGTPVSGSVTLGKVTFTDFASAQMRGAGSASLVFYSSSTAGAPVIINATDVVSGSEIYVTITYIAA